MIIDFGIRHIQPRRGVIARKINVIPSGFGILSRNFLSSCHPFGIELRKLSFLTLFLNTDSTEKTEIHGKNHNKSRSFPYAKRP